MTPQTGAGRRCAIYARVSTIRQEEEGTSLQTQTSRCREHAASHGYQVDEAHIYRETYSGAELWDRPQLTILRQAIRDHAVDVVVCYAIDRLSRDPVHLGVILTEADHHGVTIDFVSEPLDDSPEGQLIRFVRGYAARVEREKIRERQIRGKRAKLESGKIHGFGGELYGYRRDAEAGVRLIHEPEAAVVRRVFRAAASGQAVRGIAAALNAEGVPSPAAGKRTFKPDAGKSARWGKTTIWRMLGHDAYRGETILWRETGRARGGRAGARKPESEWIRLPAGTTPAIVSPAEWEAAQAALHANAGEASRNEARPYLLRGVIFCAVCGKRMYASPERDRRTYRCSSRDTAAGACGGKRVPADAIEAWVWDWIEAVLNDPTLIEAEVKRQREAGPDAELIADRARITKEIARLDAELDRLIDAFASDNGASEAELRRRLKQRAGVKEAELSVARANLNRIDERIAAQEAATAQLASLQTYCERVKDTLGDADFATRRLAIEALIERVVANSTDPEQWRIEGMIPVDVGDVSTSSARCGRRRPRLPTRA